MHSSRTPAAAAAFKYQLTVPNIPVAHDADLPAQPELLKMIHE